MARSIGWQAAAQSGDGARATGEIVSVQQLRGLAAFGVLCFHAAQRAGFALNVGAAGVDVFFAISGFIMWVVTCRSAAGPLVFLKRRVVRIVPLYWLTTLALVSLAIAAPFLFPAMRPTAGHVVESMLFWPHRDPAGQVYPLLVPGWTLNYEAFFYVVFAAALLLPARLRAIAVTLVLGGLVFCRPLLDLSNPLAETWTNPLLLEFTAGVWLGVAWTTRPLLAPPAAVAFIAAGLASFAIMQGIGLDVGPWRALAWGVPAFAIVAGAVSLEKVGRAPAFAPLKRLGDASYALYLVHGLAVSCSARVLAMAGLRHPVAVFLCAIVAGTTAGLLFHALVERPLVSLFSKRSRRPRIGEQVQEAPVAP